MEKSGSNKKRQLTVDYERMGDAQDLVRKTIEILETITNIDLQEFTSDLSMRLKNVMTKMDEIHKRIAQNIQIINSDPTNTP